MRGVRAQESDQEEKKDLWPEASLLQRAAVARDLSSSDRSDQSWPIRTNRANAGSESARRGAARSVLGQPRGPCMAAPAPPPRARREGLRELVLHSSAAPAGLSCSAAARGRPRPRLVAPPLHAVVGEPEEPLPATVLISLLASVCLRRCSRCRGLDRCRHRCGRPRPAASSSLSHHAARREHHHPNRHRRVSSSSRVVSTALAHKQAHIGAALGEAAVHAAAPGVEKSRELGGRGRQGCGGGSSGRRSDHKCVNLQHIQEQHRAAHPPGLSPALKSRQARSSSSNSSSNSSSSNSSSTSSSASRAIAAQGGGARRGGPAPRPREARWCGGWCGGCCGGCCGCRRPSAAQPSAVRKDSLHDQLWWRQPPRWHRLRIRRAALDSLDLTA